MSGINPEELVKQLKQLCHPKKTILMKENDNTPKFSSDEIISLNRNFSHSLLKIEYIHKFILKIKNKKQESEEKSQRRILETDIKRSRMHQIDAAIIKLMKQHKTLGEKDIILNILKTVVIFRVEPVMIKKSLERLIDKEYLECIYKGKKLYTYIP